MITIMIIIREKEIIALKETSSIFENETARILRQSRFKNQQKYLFNFKVFLDTLLMLFLFFYRHYNHYYYYYQLLLLLLILLLLSFLSSFLLHSLDFFTFFVVILSRISHYF